ncbi:MAG: hypothetical protein M1827_001598 [Pycnora praestabilis]|nr:MAG: hypothetical protein M1827_001598 [Pycnora praestabilis]
MSSTYGEVDLAETPCLFPRCGHILTLESMDGHMDMPKFYEMDSGGCVIATKGDTGPFSSEDIKVCPMCRGALHDIQRYNRIVKRGMIDEATKKFFVWSNQKFLPLEAKLQEEELRLQGLGTKATNADVTRLNCSINLAGSWANQIAQINGILGKANRYKITIKLRQEISNYLHTVSEAEQPFSKVFQLVENTRRRYQTKTTFTLDSSVLQVRGRLLATVLSLRCDLAILSDFLQFRSAHAVQTPLAQESTFDFSVNRLLCIQLFDDAAKKDQPMHQVEACVFFARFVALERSSPAGGMEIMTNLLAEAREKLTLAKGVCQRAPSTLSMLPEIEDTEKLLRDSTFYTTFTNDEKRAVYAAMATELRGTGHWYYCENMHPFTVGECGMPMQQARCPQCGAPVGGQNHTAAQGVRPAADFEAEFGRLRV